MSACASATRLRPPPESDPMRALTSVTERWLSTVRALVSRSKAPLASSAAARPVMRASALSSPLDTAWQACSYSACRRMISVLAANTASSTVRSGSKVGFWARYATEMPRANTTRPLSGSSRPDKMRSSVDLPHPFTPMNPTLSPRSTPSVTPSSTGSAR